MRQALIRRGVGRRAAAALLLLFSLVVVVLPMLVLAPHLADQMLRGIPRVQVYFSETPEQPAWISSVPIAGRRLGAMWDRVVEVKGNLRALMEPYTANFPSVPARPSRNVPSASLTAMRLPPNCRPTVSADESNPNAVKLRFVL